jgi:small subunit ribosomal protein S4
MARYTGPKCKLCRREGQKLYLKGARCLSDKCAMVKRPQSPGQHGNTRGRLSTYGLQLREKQKAKRIYGILEKKFTSYVSKALKARGNSGEVLVQNLETRFDNIVYRSGFAVSRSQARQFIRSGFFTINGKVNNIPSTAIKVEDIIAPVEISKIHLREGYSIPEWLVPNVKEKNVKFVRMPVMEDVQGEFNVQSIIEFYSR